MRVSSLLLVGIVLTSTLHGNAWARPPGPKIFCDLYASSPACVGVQVSCATCHSSVPNRNLFGASIEAHLAVGQARPLTDDSFSAALPSALASAAALDPDLDGVSNEAEITLGTNPADGKDFPRGLTCTGKDNPQYKVCAFDAAYAFKKLKLDFCGASPTFEEMTAFAALAEAAQSLELDRALDDCLASEFWIGKNGALWQLAHPKIRPVGSLKAGTEEVGDIPLADYDDDYAMFVYAHTGDHDVRDVLLADYYVKRTTNPTRYSKVDTLPRQFVAKDKRAGNITTAWMLAYFVMFTALPRNIAAQVYRSYLGLDIARQAGLVPVSNEPVDYDQKGVTATACAACHSTLDPLSYVFRNYNGLTGGVDGPYAKTYVPNRIALGFSDLFPGAPLLPNLPEAGAMLGQPVANLREWATVAANSDAFAINTVADYWKLATGGPPRAEDNATFVSLWQRLKGEHRYRVSNMLHDLVHTEAYGAP